jgi:signal transduction histidine kinase
VKGRSLRLRLLVAAVASISLALVIAGLGLVALFDRHVERRVDAELATYLRQLAGLIVFDAKGDADLDGDPADPRFDQPYGGLYWQIEDTERQQVLRSRSLWDQQLDLTAEPEAGSSPEITTLYAPGPQESTLRVALRRIQFPASQGARWLVLAVAVDQREQIEARRDFLREIAPSLALLAAVLIASAWLQVNVGLKPLEHVRRGVQAIRARAQRRLDGDFPDEIQPLAQEVNELLAVREAAVERARAQAGDLAHGLKTPLTILAQDARKLKERGETEIGREVDELTRSMQRHIDRELARARIAGSIRSPGTEADLPVILRHVTDAIRRTPRGEAVQWSVDLPAHLCLRMDAQDLVELAGNLVDNAAKWAREHVAIRIAERPSEIALVVEDDGRGVPPDLIASLGERGVRLDESLPGTGLGLAISRDLVTAYGGSLDLSNRPEGGLRAEVRLPRNLLSRSASSSRR